MSCGKGCNPCNGCSSYSKLESIAGSYSGSSAGSNYVSAPSYGGLS